MPIDPDVLERSRIRPTWVVMPALANPELTRKAIVSVLCQTVPIQLLIVNQGVDDDFRHELEQLAEEYGQLHLWSHQPPLPSLSATWNRALRFVWESGGEEALVVNNDVELRPETVQYLKLMLTTDAALFVSAVGVTADDFARCSGQDLLSKGGPDFSCFLISRECHDRFLFDEHFTPAFCEDLDYHRRLMLAGEGQRIFSVNLPYLHHGSATLKTVDPKERMRIDRAIETGSRAYYARKWGGPVNQERLTAPFGQDGQSGWNDGRATTPAIYARVRQGLPPIGCPAHDDQPADACERCAEAMQEAADGQTS